jgi:hypothetical protein
VPLVAEHFLGGVIASCLSLRGLDRLAFDDGRRGADFTPGPLAVEPQFDVVDGLEQETTCQFAEIDLARVANATRLGQGRLSGAWPSGEHIGKVIIPIPPREFLEHKVFKKLLIPASKSAKLSSMDLKRAADAES